MLDHHLSLYRYRVPNDTLGNNKQVAENSFFKVHCYAFLPTVITCNSVNKICFLLRPLHYIFIIYFLSEHHMEISTPQSGNSSALAVYCSYFIQFLFSFCGFGCSDSFCVVYMASAVSLAFRLVSTDILSSFVLLQLFLCLSVYI